MFLLYKENSDRTYRTESIPDFSSETCSETLGLSGLKMSPQGQINQYAKFSGKKYDNMLS
jgi:hypothetical protein